MLPKKGKIVPGDNGQGQDKADYAMMIAKALREQLGTSHQGTKTVMRWTGASERTVKNWFSGANGPRGEHMIALVRHSDEILDVFLRMAGRRNIIAATKLADARTKLAEALEFIEMLLADKAHDVSCSSSRISRKEEKSEERQ